jgi:DNA-binding ferritin-like protein
MSRQNNDNYDSKAEIERVERGFEPQNFAKNFCEAAQSQTNVNQILQTIIRQSLQTDQMTRDTVKGLIKEYEKEAWSVIIRRSFSVSWTAFIAIISSAIGYWIK